MSSWHGEIDDHVDCLGRQHFVDSHRFKPSNVGRSGSSAIGNYIGDGDELQLRQSRQCREVLTRNPAGSNDSDD